MTKILKSLGFSSNCYLCGCVSAVDNSADYLDKIQTSQINSPIICKYCHQRLPISKNCCFSCGLPITKLDTQTKNDFTEHDKIACGECLKNSPIYDRVISPFHYEAPISDIITQLKFSAQFQLLPLLSAYLIKKINMSYSIGALPQLLIAMPLHPNKLVERGFNQSRLIAARVADSLNIPLLNKGVSRIKETQAQSELDSVERKRNMKKAFDCSVQVPAHIAIIDDVVTTGATVSELTRQLMKHGANKIDIWSIARAYDL